MSEDVADVARYGHYLALMMMILPLARLLESLLMLCCKDVRSSHEPH